MTMRATRRDFIIGAGLLAAAVPFPVLAQDKPKLRFSAVFSEQDIRAEMMKVFAEGIKDDFAFEGWGDQGQRAFPGRAFQAALTGEDDITITPELLPGLKTVADSGLDIRI